MSDDTWVPFSHRYGIADPASVDSWCTQGGEDFATEAWRARHHATSDAAARFTGDPEPLFRCACPGSFGRVRCADRASQEDRLCDACREHCWAVDDAKTYHRLIDVYGVGAA